MLTDLSNELADIVAAAAPSVVQVHGRRRPASGVVYAANIVVTVTRAIEREEGLEVRQHDGKAAAAEFLGWDPATSLAVLRAVDLDAPALAPSSASPRVGQLAVALARSWSNAITASAGIVAVIGGPLHTGRSRRIDQVLRTTAPMHEGFAGGAFLDASGGLVGICTAAAIRGLGVVIPSAIAWKTAGGILEHGKVKRGYIGIAGQPVALPDHQRGATQRDRGLLVLAVTPDGPAARAGVLVGDVLVAVEETPLESPEELMDLLMTTGAGHKVTLQVLRGTSLVQLDVTTGERPAR
jgi:S1-C subfamily serine protease